jgi:hypothetical protein
MTESPINRLRELAKQKAPDPRDLYEWTVPVSPTDLRWLLAQYDALVIANDDLKMHIAKNGQFE